MDPYQMLSKDEMTILKSYYVRESDRGWTSERKHVVAKLLGKIRQHGISIIGLYPSGSLRFGIKKKSVLEMAMELPDEKFREFQAGRLRYVNGDFVEVSIDQSRN